MTGSEKTWRWYWMSATVFLLGMSSVFLLLWIDRLNEERNRNIALVDALLDVQLHTEMFHLRLEEYIRGESPGDIKDVFKDWEKADRLIEASLRGGVNELELTLRPLRKPESRAQGENIRALLFELRNLALERVRESGKNGTIAQSRLHDIFRETFSRASVLERALERENSLYLSQSGRLSDAILLVWILVVSTAVTGLWIGERKRKRAGEELGKAHEQLLLQAEELMEHRERLAELVEKRTAELTGSIKRLNAEVTERRQAEESLKETEKQVRHLSSRLLTAQEIERRRISMELHDELGQALNGIKYQIRAIERELTENQKGVREDCENLMRYMDQVIEDVRRLSLDLSPTVLEDLGLTSALKWLVDGFNKNPAMRVISDIGDVDDLIPENQWIVVYRVIQEALTNINRHALAENVAIAIRRQNGRVAFAVEDDGKGFDPERTAMKTATERGLGLTTMSERVKMIGGFFDLWSREGTGTRITFSIPSKKAGVVNGQLQHNPC